MRGPAAGPWLVGTTETFCNGATFNPGGWLVGASKRKRGGSSLDPVAAAQSKVLSTFEKQARRQLSPVLGDAGMRRVRTDLAISTTVGGGVIVQAPLRLPARFDPHQLERKSEIAAVLGTTIPLIDPVTLTVLEPGMYAWAVRKVGPEFVAFDFFNQRGAPALSVLAREKGGGPISVDFGLVDIEITVGGIDSIVPPGEVFVCLSLLIWKTCFFLILPKLPWP